jgi:glycosyltransferase involved in cell wall biosynthesis
MAKEVMVCIPCLLLGGSELATLSFLKALAPIDCAFTVCCYFEHNPAMVRRFESAGARVVLLGLSRGSPRRLVSRLVDFFGAERPEAVHVQYLAPGLLPILAARRAGVPQVFATVHAAGSGGYGWKAKALLRFAALLTDHVFCVSRNAERFWFGCASVVTCAADLARVRHSTIYNCVDVACIQAAGLDVGPEGLCPGLPRGAKVIGIVGRLIQLKGHLTLLRAMKHVRRVVPDAFLLIIGAGPDEADFRREAERLGLNDHILWKGPVEPELLPRHYHRMDVVAMPSRWEGFGLAAAEAMAAGKPVVGTNVPGLREVVHDGVTGFLVPVDDPEALAQRLAHLLSDDSLRAAMGRAGLDRARRLFDVPAHKRRWLEAYTVLLGPGPQARMGAAFVPHEGHG